MRFELREATSPLLLVMTPIAAIVLSLLLCAGFIAAAGAPVLGAYGHLAKGAFGSTFAITETLTRATPLILTGLSAAVAFRARLWNIGAEGQLYLGAIVTAALGAHVEGLPGWLADLVLILCGGVPGMLLLLGPTLLKLKLGVDEVVTTLLLNFIVLLLVSALIEGPLRDPLAFGFPQSAPVSDAAMLPKLVAHARLHAGFVIAVVLALAVAVIDGYSVLGFAAQAVGFNIRAARFAGIPIERVLVYVALMSGGLAGIGGALEVIGLKGYVTLDMSPGYGYAGIIVAMLAGLHPLGVVFSSIFVAGIFVGADAMGRAYNIPSAIADVIVAVSLLTMLLALLFARYRLRWA
jgi:general nucleoside transport system permease protein